MRLFDKKSQPCRFDPARQIPVLRCSICTGEQTAGFRDRETGHFSEIMLIRDPSDLDRFRMEYGISGPIHKEY